MKDIQAFPLPANQFDSMKPGMTLRDYFAAHVLTGLMMQKTFPPHDGDIAQRAYEVADAMIKERDNG